MRADTSGQTSKSPGSGRMDENSCMELVESVNSIILRWNADFIITYVNDYGERFFGYRRGELLGRSVLGTIVRETSGEGVDMAEMLRNIFRHPERYVNNENENLLKDGSRVWVSWTNRAMIDGEGRVAEVLSIGNDITDRKRMEEELRKAKEELEARVLERTRELQASNEALRREVREHRKAEDALRESERKFKAIFDQTFEFIGLMSVDGRLLAANQTALKFEGIEEADVIGKPLWETPWWTHSRDLQDKVRAAIGRAAAGEFVRFDVTHRDARGNLRYGDFSIKPVRDEAGRVVLLIPESRDVTDAKLAEKALRESEARLHSIFRAAPVGIGLTVNRKIVEVNARLCEMVGYDRAELIGRSARLLYPTEEDYAFVGREKYRQISENGTGTVETRWRHKDGHSLDVLLSSTPIDPENLSEGITFTALDITERKRAEEAILRLTRQDEEALSVAHMGHWEYDIATGTFIFNDQYYTLHGITAEEAGGYRMSAEEFVHRYVDPEYAHTVKDALEAAQKTTDPSFAFRTDSRILRADGEPRDVTVWFRAEKDASGRTVRLYGVNQDITERKRAEKALEHAKAQAELYVDLMGHDISNMNQAILGFLELAELSIPMEPAQRELIEKPIEIINHSARMIDNVRKLERVQQDRYGEKVVDMCALIASVAREFSLAEGRCVTINRIMPDTCRVVADDILRDVFSNIVDNSIRHSGDPVVIDIVVEPLEAGDRRYFRASIADNGPGIPDEQKRRVFSFMQGCQAKPGRRGLGLCLVKTLVEHFDGRVWVENRVPEDYRQGAKFIVELPAA